MSSFRDHISIGFISKWLPVFKGVKVIEGIEPLELSLIGEEEDE